MKQIPSKKYSMTLWYLLYRIPTDIEIGDAQITEAIQRFKYPLADFLNEQEQHAQKYARMLRKRQLRHEYVRKHGDIQKMAGLHLIQSAKAISGKPGSRFKRLSWGIKG